MNIPPNREVGIFSAAIELPVNQRAAYLQEACGDDPALRVRLEALLRVHEDAITFLETLAPGAGASPMSAEVPGAPDRLFSSPAEKPGDHIGHYKLLEQIGEGGCGVVYMAEQQEPVRRRVALKVIKLGMDTKQVIARFEAERQALALMDHPNIAKVLDAGASETGRPFFVMELVSGIKITDYCDQNNLTTAQRLDLFLAVCKAVQHAHQKGIIHRDIKPSNILVTLHDGVPVPKVIDFGIAKATTDQRLTNKTVFTAFAQFMGTPAYMSPEQAEMSGLDIDTRTDIYSLGVLLYELLTGKTPFDAEELLKSGLDEMRRTIREREPARPSTRLSTMIKGELASAAKHRQSDAAKLVHLFRGDLDWIVMKCLEKDRIRRYETANGLMMDIQRYASNEPVMARPPTNLYRFQKLVRRNKSVFAAVTALALMLVLGVVVSTWQALRAGRAEQAQARLKLQAVAEKKTAQSEASKSQQVAQFLKDMLQGVGPSVALGRDTKMLREILDKTAERIGIDLTNQPEVAVELCLTLAETYHDLGLYEQIEGLARQSLQLARARPGEENESVAASLIWLGDALKHRAQIDLGDMQAGNVEPAEKDRHLHNGNLVEAERYCYEGLAMSRKLLGNENLKVANALNNLASVFSTQYRLAEAETMQREALAMYQKLIGNEHPTVAKLLYELALMLSFQYEKQAEAEIMNREALAMQRKLLGNDHPEIAKSLFRLAIVLRLQGKQAEAVTTFREVLAMWRKLQANDRIEFADALSQLARTLIPQGKLAEAETMEREALGVKRRLFETEHPEVAISLSSLAFVLMNQGKLVEAETMHREALAMRRKLLGHEHAEVAWSLSGLANVLQRQGKLAEAETMYREELAIRRKLLGNEHDFVTWTLQSLANVLEEQGKLPEAETLLRETLSAVRKKSANDPSEEISSFRVESAVVGLAAFLRREKKYAEAEPLWREALASARRFATNDADRLELRLADLADCLRNQKRFDESELLYREAAASAWRSATNDASRFEVRVNDVADLLQQQGKATELERFFIEVLNPPPESQPLSVSLLRGRASLFARHGHWKAAAADFSTLVELAPENHEFYHALAPLLVQSGDLQGYRLHCAQEIARFAGTNDPNTVERMAKDCLILHDSGVDLIAVSAWADTAVTAGKDSIDLPWFQFCKGLAEYRQEHFAAAVDWMQKVLSHAGDNLHRDVEAYTVLAMAQYQLKQIDESRATFAKGVEIAERKLPNPNSGDLGNGWLDWIIAQVLMTEAKALIQLPTAASKE